MRWKRENSTSKRGCNLINAGSAREGRQRRERTTTQKPIGPRNLSRRRPCGGGSEAALHEHQSLLSRACPPLYQKGRKLWFGRKRPQQTLGCAEPKTITECSAVDHAGIGTVPLDLSHGFTNQVIAGLFELQFRSDDQG